MQPNEIFVNIHVYAQGAAGEVKYKISVNKNIPFEEFCNGILEEIFSKQQQLRDAFKEKIVYSFSDQDVLPNERKTLAELGMKNEEIIKLRMLLKGGRIKYIILL